MSQTEVRSLLDVLLDALQREADDKRWLQAGRHRTRQQ
jgi:hypothetical protein